MDSDEGVLLPIHQHPMVPWHEKRWGDCCGEYESISDDFYCKSCDFFAHKKCSEFSQFLDHPSHHSHTLRICNLPGRYCKLCGKNIDDIFYRCQTCDFNIDLRCAKEYSDGTCRLCEKKIDEKIFYHCSSCNFSLDMCCVSTPPPLSLLNLKAHDHQLFLLPSFVSFTCNACGLKGDRSPYICVQCGFMIHQDCIGLPRVININRHDHRISRTSLLYVEFVARSYVVHSKCATRRDVWNGMELEGVPEETEDTEPYVVIDDNTIQHFSHKEHHLRLNTNGLLSEDNKHCKACAYSIGLQPFYGCIMDCDFFIHQICAGFPTGKWHVLHNERLTLVTSEKAWFYCDACGRMSNGFRYQHGETNLDRQCSSISEPFVHPSHPHHPLYYTSPNEERQCNGCKRWKSQLLMCIEDGCGFPWTSNEASGKYWCDICEKETNSEKWFYTCKDHRASLHTKCVLGDLTILLPRSTINIWCMDKFEVVLKNAITRPICKKCTSLCIYPINLKQLGTSDVYVCSFICYFQYYWKIG
ncbi:hypothetical protein EUTSA_v10028254mg [Eutrema salsugineum]|uniref:Phorbol-ester/DAG-type domain-containing protein n=1 Tax=Eutrema salsugineum TaxID=72664 RepID=V4LX79_EUTSA|nr:hypothetical protein EUTSA_v10028254mg [Eutrema salsugineum]